MEHERSGPLQHRFRSNTIFPRLAPIQYFCWKTSLSTPLSFCFCFFFNFNFLEPFSDLPRSWVHLWKAGSSCYAMPQFPVTKQPVMPGWPGRAQTQCCSCSPKSGIRKPAHNWVVLFFSRAATCLEKKEKKVNDATSHCWQVHIKCNTPN